MIVFLPFNRDQNKYLDEIENYFQGSFIYGSINDYKTDYDIVNIHWPEAIFSWEEPSNKELFELEITLQKWKVNSKIIYTRHNIYPHYRNTKKFKELYNIVLKYADGIIHLGGKSLDQLINKYPNIYHDVVEHPLYSTIPNNISKKDARKKLGIKDKSNVILVFGKIRDKEELVIIRQAFRKSNIKNKILLIPRYQYFYNDNPTLIERIRIKTLRLINSYNAKLKFFNNFVPDQEIQNYFNASDVVFIARKQILNSGNIFLGFSFKKTIVGPLLGNISEVLEESDYPTYNPNDIESISKALEKAIEISKTQIPIKNYLMHQRKYHPERIAIKLLNFYKKIINE